MSKSTSIDAQTDSGAEASTPQTAPESPFPLYLSPSQVTSLLTCGEKFRLTRVERVPERPMWASIGGSAVHKITEILDLEHWKKSHE